MSPVFETDAGSDAATYRGDETTSRTQPASTSWPRHVYPAPHPVLARTERGAVSESAARDSSRNQALHLQHAARIDLVDRERERLEVGVGDRQVEVELFRRLGTVSVASARQTAARFGVMRNARTCEAGRNVRILTCDSSSAASSRSRCAATRATIVRISTARLHRPAARRTTSSATTRFQCHDLGHPRPGGGGRSSSTCTAGLRRRNGFAGFLVLKRALGLPNSNGSSTPAKIAPGARLAVPQCHEELVRPCIASNASRPRSRNSCIAPKPAAWAGRRQT